MSVRVAEFQCIMPMENIPSVLVHGILSHERAEELPHRSVAMQDIQNRRDPKKIPGGLSLHQYANLYFHARNPMMYRRQEQASSICVLRISTQICSEIDGVVITDQNAASKYVRFYSPNEMYRLNLDLIYALDWAIYEPPDPRSFIAKSAKCAEVLVPHEVPVKYIIGAYVVDVQSRNQLSEFGFDKPIDVNSDIFFH